MSETIQWAELEPREKVRLIIEKVMGWRLYDTFDEYHKALWVTGKYVDIGYPVAFWSDQWNHWAVCYRDKEGGLHFNPLESMDAAWQVIRRINNPNSPTFPDYQEYANFIEELEKIVGSNMFFDLFYCDHEGDHLTPERICLAALRACGVKVE